MVVLITTGYNLLDTEYELYGFNDDLKTPLTMNITAIRLEQIEVLLLRINTLGSRRILLNAHAIIPLSFGCNSLLLILIITII